MIIDTHAHLDMKEFDADREAVIARAREQGVDYILNIGSDLPSSRRSVELTEHHDFIYASAGVHPHDVSAITGDTWPELRDLHQHPKVVAVGEIGLDYYRNHSPQDVQRLNFRKQIELALELKKPIIVHCRDAGEDIAEILAEYYPEKNDGRSGIFHCFSGDLELARRALRMGFYISFAGPVTFKNAESLREVARNVPADRLFVETDCPYLAPAPHRGKRNEPSFARHTADYIAQLRGLKPEDVHRTMALSFYELFGIGEAAPSGTLAYRIRNSLYLNLTQRCTNNCTFCTRLTRPVVQGYNLALKREPSADELWRAIDDVKKYEEIVFCGYGEPTLRLDVIKDVAGRIKKAGGRVRINTNGHANAIHGRNIVPELKGLVDEVSVSLNADSAEAYDDICRPWPQFRGTIYNQIREFIAEAKKHLPLVTATIVTEQSGVDEKICADIATKELGVNYRPRRYNLVGEA